MVDHGKDKFRKQKRLQVCADFDEDNIKKAMKKTKKPNFQDKLEQSRKDYDISAFLQGTFERVKNLRLEKTDPSFKNFVEKTIEEGLSQTSLLDNTIHKNRKINLYASSMGRITDKEEGEEHGSPSLDNTQIEGQECSGKTPEMQRPEYQCDYVVGYISKYNTIRDLKSTMIKDSVKLIRADSLAKIWDKVNVFLYDSELKQNLSIVYCILHDIPIVRHDWVSTSLKCQKILDPKKFLFDFDFRRNIFDKLSIMVYSHKMKVAPSEIITKETELLKNAILYFGGKVKRFYSETDILIVPESLEEKLQIPQVMKELKDAFITVVNSKWLVDSIIEGIAKNTSNEAYRLLSRL